MYSGILNSDKTISVNIAIMRAFVFIRQYSLSHQELTEKLKEQEDNFNIQFEYFYEAINYLLQKDKLGSDQKDINRIGYR